MTNGMIRIVPIMAASEALYDIVAVWVRQLPWLVMPDHYEHLVRVRQKQASAAGIEQPLHFARHT